MKNILLIATGGTIASVNFKNGLVPELNVEEIIRYIPQIKQLCNLTAIQLFNLDSTNILPQNWIQIADVIQKNYKNYDGFLILHGTDTMAYTSAALSYLIQNSKKPIVLTGSQKPISYDISDAKINLLNSILYLIDEFSSGVNIVFDSKVIVGTRARKTKTKSFDAFSSIDFPYKAIIRDSKITHYIYDEINEPVKFYNKLNSKVFVLKLIPSLDAGIFDYLKLNYDAVVIEGFGIGGIPNIKEMKFTDKIDEFVSLGKTVVLTTQVPLEGSDFSVYEVGKSFKHNTNILEGRTMILEAIVTKLMWIMQQDLKQNENELFYKKINYDII